MRRCGPAPILGHYFREVAMTITVPWIWIEAAIGIGCCAIAGCVLGLVVTGARIVGERHGS